MREKLEAAQPPEAVMKEATRELTRLEAIPSASPVYGVIRTWLQIISELPWAKSTSDILDLAEARRILDRDHFDLDKVKRRIIEYLAVLKLKRDRNAKKAQLKKATPLPRPLRWARRTRPPQTDRGPRSGESRRFRATPAKRRVGGAGAILCFVGPPGVGKTSLGKSIAESMGRTFIRVALGGVRDEADIRGHRRTYIGSMPGRIIAELRKAGTHNPVMMLDEIDKLGADFRGDPASRRCWKCSTPRKTTPSPTTIWTCRSTSARCCSSPQPTAWTRSPARCATAWK